MHRLHGRSRRDFCGDGGSSAVEFALVLPLLALLFFGLFEMGRVYWTYHIVSGAVRDAARYGARLPADCNNLGAYPYNNVISTMARTGSPTGTTPLIAGWTADQVTVSVTCPANTYTSGSSTGTFSGRYEGFDKIPRITVRGFPGFSSVLSGLIPGFEVSSVSVTHSEAWTE